MRRTWVAAGVIAALIIFMAGAASAVEVGQKAPDFELPSTKGGKLKLSGFQGKKSVLIEFYILDFTPM
jgi:peroxiredoxin Q/BCP